ncbi:MAG: hypothetical protein P4M15_12415 [Alphaproteobacteria bacterium]|nr:hypothetical protein [Alphaproteobacteria bacterium]
MGVAMFNAVKHIKKWWGGYWYESDPNSKVASFALIYPRPRICWDKFKLHIKKYWQFWGGILAGGAFTLLGMLHGS